ncbi:MAG: polyphosphate polymerase domain-containing protein [Bacteroidetes bacterium]|nr:polyphosphate polymerase domain-containing protein [Bacteroidota bacterium]
MEDYKKLTNNRFERKFAVNNLSIQEIESIVKRNSVLFCEIFKQRFINNIYLDTQNLTCFFDNNIGNTNREKIRIRWYGDMFGLISHPILEFKIKKGNVGTKLSFPLSPFKLDKDFSIDILKQAFYNSNLPHWVINKLNVLEPTLLNRYKRKYFRSFNKDYRITLDFEVEYINIGSRINSLSQRKNEGTDVVVELKYDVEKDDFASQITNQFPFRMTKNSKYVNGISKFRTSLAF